MFVAITTVCAEFRVVRGEIYLTFAACEAGATISASTAITAMPVPFSIIVCLIKVNGFSATAGTRRTRTAGIGASTTVTAYFFCCEFIVTVYAPRTNAMRCTVLTNYATCPDYGMCTGL